MSLRLKLQLVVVADDDEQVSVDELVVLTKDYEQLEHVGLSLAEAKALLLEVQRQVVSRQIAAFLASRTPCPTCGRRRGIKDHKTIVFRTLFGKLELVSPRLRRCPCQHVAQASMSPLVELLPEHTAPELLVSGEQVGIPGVVRADRQSLAGLLACGRAAARDSRSSGRPERCPPPGDGTRS
jgi:hypothetical protein